MLARTFFTTSKTESQEKKAIEALSTQNYSAIAYLYKYTKRLEILWERQRNLANRFSFPAAGQYKALTEAERKATPFYAIHEKNIDYFDYSVLFQSWPKEILNAVKAFNQYFEEQKTDTELMNKLNAFIEKIENGLEDFTKRTQGKGRYNYPRRKLKKQYEELFYRLCPELALFVQRHFQEMQAQNSGSPHSIITFDWNILKQINPLLLRLKEQIQQKAYSLNTWMSTEEDMTAECSTEIIKQIEIFSEWFSDEQIKIHQLSDNHMSCIRANKDFIYMISMITTNAALSRLWKDLKEVQALLDFYNVKGSNTLSELRSKEKEEYGENLQLSLSVKKLRSKISTVQSIDQTKATITSAVKESLDKEAASQKSLKIIKSILKYSDQSKHSLSEQSTFSQIIKIIEETKTVVTPETPKIIADDKLILPNPSPQLNPEYRPTQSLLSWIALERIHQSLNGDEKETTSLYKTIKFKNHKNIFGSMTDKEREKLVLIDYMEAFNEFFTRSQRGAEALREANESLIDLLHRIKISTELEQDKEIFILTKKLASLYSDELAMAIRRVRLDLATIQSYNEKMRIEILQLQALVSKHEGVSSESVMAFYIKQACQQQSSAPKPYENALQKIVALSYLILQKQEPPTPTIESLTICHSIFDAAKKAITPLEQQPQIARLPSYQH